MVKNNKYVLLIGMILAVFAVVCLSKAADTQQMSEEQMSLLVLSRNWKIYRKRRKQNALLWQK